MQKLTVEQYKEIKKGFEDIYYNKNGGIYGLFQTYLKSISEEETVKVRITYTVSTEIGVLQRIIDVVLPQEDADALGPSPYLKVGGITIGKIIQIEMIA